MIIERAKGLLDGGHNTTGIHSFWPKSCTSLTQMEQDLAAASAVKMSDATIGTSVMLCCRLACANVILGVYTPDLR
jgi:hypothetical protein